MDFHCLTRKELQTLCKKNKIPANITNVAMADALKSLEIVEGMDEFLKPCDSETAHSTAESPEKTINASPTVPPRTSCRTSTRRKPNQVQGESESILSRTRRGTRRTISGGVENAKVDLPETPAMQSSRKKAPAALTRRKIESQLKEEAEEEKQAPETPAATTTTRRRGTVDSSRRKTDTMKAEDNSVRKGYSTRRTTRLLEKRMMELNLNNEEGIQVVDASDTEIAHLERNVKGDSDASDVNGMNQQAISDDLEAFSDKICDVLSENLRELDDPVQECMENNHQVDCLKVEPSEISVVFDKSDEHKDILATENDNDNDEVNHENKDTEQIEVSEVFDESDAHKDRLANKNDNNDDDDVNHESKDEDASKTKSVASCEIYSDSDILSGENLEKSLHPKNDNLSKKGGCVYSSGNVMDTVAAPQSSMLRETNHSLSVEPVVDEDSAKTEFNGLAVPVGAEVQKHNLELQSLASKESDINSVKCQFCTDYDSELNDVPDLKFGIATTELSDEKALCDYAEIDLETNEVEGLESTPIAEDKSKDMAVGNKAEVGFDKSPVDDAEDKSKDRVESNKAEVDLEKGPFDDAATVLEANEGEVLESTPIAEGKSKDKAVSDKAEVDFEKALVDDAETDLEANEVVDPESALMAEGKSLDLVLSDNAEVDLVDYLEHSSGSNQLEIEGHLTSETLHYGEESDDTESSKTDELESYKPATTESAAHVAIIDVAENNMFDQLAGQNSINFDNHMPSPPKTADPFPVQMTYNSDNMTCPASLTPMKKSSSSTPTTNRKINLLDINKENIDNSGKKLDLTKDKGKKDNKKNTVELADASLRQLRKMFKQTLQITNDTDISEEKNVAKQVGRARQALQTLPENRLAATESGNGS